MSIIAVAGEHLDDGGGYFTSSGRRAALNASLPLLASYFADAATWKLEVAPQLAVEDEPPDELLDDFAAGARLRASLAAAERLLTIISAVAAQPTFRYTQVSAESVGTIRGRLDLARYSRQHGRIDVPRRYPIRLVARANATAENVLVTYAALWIRRDLAAIPRRILPSSSPEERALQTLEQALKRVLGLPLLVGTAPQAREVWRLGTLDDLVDQVTRRLAGGQIARPEPYEELTSWISESRGGSPVAATGDHDWSFYDEQFDTKLFEIWCLFKLAQQITAKIGDPVGPPRSLAARRKGPIYVWNVGGGTLKLHFQPSLATLDGGVLWQYEGGGDLRGFPDIAVIAENFAGRSLALLDPKLRQRIGAPTEEIYKLIGYFGNLRRDGPPLGAILYYSPRRFTEYQLSRDGGGEIRAIGLDPEAGDAQFASAAEVALRTTGLSSAQALELLGTRVGGTDLERNEHAAGVRQAIAVEAMRRAAEALPPATLAPTRKQTAANLHAIWGSLSDQTRTMLVTAEYFANTAPDNADHSGPLLGLAASVERVLREAVLDPVTAASPGVIPSGQTLGSCLRTLDNALRGRNDPEARAVAKYLPTRSGIDQDALASILPEAKAMNRDYRIPAAHAEVVSATTWARGRDVIINTATGILPRLVLALGSASP